MKIDIWKRLRKKKWITKIISTDLYDNVIFLRPKTDQNNNNLEYEHLKS
jgi:hypothetical protein